MNQAAFCTWTASPLGDLLLTSDGTALTGLSLTARRSLRGAGAAGERRDELFIGAVDQLTAYFDGRLTRFDLPLAPAGTPFQRSVWSALQEIPYGATATYGEIAQRVGRPGAARAVGRANGQNPIAILIPCHRVIGASGRLTGYGGGLERKQQLLDLEARNAEAAPDSTPRPLSLPFKFA